jgi:DNA invertase Pin-like site-specific DNA recombinase
MPKIKDPVFSYDRFSHPSQADGDSVRRQTAKRNRWLKKHGAKLDTSLTLQDKGVSAFTGEHRTNPDRHALAAFLELVRQGRIPRGAYLIVENLDRLTREDIQPALLLVLGLLQAGIRIVQLLPVEVIYDDKSNAMAVMMMVMELSRGHSESVMKSERVGSAWKEKKRRAAVNREPVTARSPAWLRLVDGQWHVIESAAQTVRDIFRWAIDGHGLGVIAKRLNGGAFVKTRSVKQPDGTIIKKRQMVQGTQQMVPTISTEKDGAKHWARSTIAKILANRAVIGEYQPYAGRARKRRAEGEPITGYYPPIVSEQDFFAARAALANRRNKPGRTAKAGINVFANLLHDARDGGTFVQVNKGIPSGARALAPYRAVQGMGKYLTFPVAVFERAVLSYLREIDPRELLPKKDRSGEKVMALSGRLEELDGQIEKLKVRLQANYSDAVADVLERHAANKASLTAELTLARQEAASPVLEAWGQARSLIDVLDNAPDQQEVRTKLRAAIRRIVGSIQLLIVRRGLVRLCAIQIWFTNTKQRRDYLIYHKQAHAGGMAKRTEARSMVVSLATVLKPGDLDLRQPDHARRLEKALTKMDLTALQ